MNTETLNFYGIVLGTVSFLIIGFATIAEHIIYRINIQKINIVDTHSLIISD